MVLKKYRTTVPSSPTRAFENHNGNGKKSDEKESDTVGNLLTRQALKTYESPNHVIKSKYEVYSGAFVDLPR